MGFLTVLLAALKAKGATLAGGAALGLGVAAMMRLGPGMLAKLFGKQLDRMLDLQNPDDKELGLALVKWVEKKLPDSGLGQERYKLAAAKIARMFPAMAAFESKLAEFIETSVAAMDAEAKKRGSGAS